MQKQIVALASAIVVIWCAITLAMVINQWATASDRQELAAKQAAATASEKRIAAYRDSVSEMASDLDARQGQLEEWQDAYFGNVAMPLTSSEAGPDTAKSDKSAPAATLAPASLPPTAAPHALKKIAALDAAAANTHLPPEVRKLLLVAKRQEILSERLLSAVNDRAANAELAVRNLGLNPDLIVRKAVTGRGGPFIPYRNNLGKAKTLGGSFISLERALFRMEVLERTLVALPSGNPADVMMMSSGFGYRSDPFNGAGAMHAGLDFRGPIGTPILAAAPGRVTFVGVKSGYGNVIEVDHGQAIMTRYAHLSGYTTKVGSKVAAGEQIGKMGSTGRSTGSHLHFEVRLNGVAVNPRRFLEAKPHILEVKADASQRVGDIAGPVI